MRKLVALTIVFVAYRRRKSLLALGDKLIQDFIDWALGDMYKDLG